MNSPKPLNLDNPIVSRDPTDKHGDGMEAMMDSSAVGVESDNE